MKEAGLIEIKKYFKYENTVEFMKEWKSFSEEEKKWWKVEVGKLLHPDEE